MARITRRTLIGGSLSSLVLGSASLILPKSISGRNLPPQVSPHQTHSWVRPGSDMGFSGLSGGVYNVRNALGYTGSSPVLDYHMDLSQYPQDVYILRNAVNQDISGGACQIRNFWDWITYTYPNGRAYAGNEPELQSYACGPYTTVQGAAYWMRQMYDQCVSYGITGAWNAPFPKLFSPGFSHLAFTNGQDGTPMKTAVAPDGYTYSWAEAWIKWLYYYGYAMPLHWHFHAYPNWNNQSLTAQQGYDYVRSVCNAVWSLVSRYRGNQTMEIWLSEVGWPNCAVTGDYGSPNWQRANEFASLIANGFRNGDLPYLNKICWFIGMSEGHWGGYLLYTANGDPQPHVCGQSHGLANYRATYNRTPIGTTWRSYILA